MKYLLLFMFIPSICFAQAHDYRISDSNGDVATISSGSLVLCSVNDGTYSNTGGAHDKRISDNNGNVASLTSSGALKITFE